MHVCVCMFVCGFLCGFSVLCQDATFLDRQPHLMLSYVMLCYVWMGVGVHACLLLCLRVCVCVFCGGVGWCVCVHGCVSASSCL